MFLNLGLGRMGCLVGALGISAALDLNFASGTFPPQVTHSRSSSATQVYSDGLVDYAPENLLLYSRTLSNGAWTGSNRSISDDTTADPPDTTNGTTADTIVENTAAAAFHWIAQAVTKPAVAERYLFTGYCHSSSARDIAVYLQNGANGCNARFRPSTGVNTGPAATFGSGWSSVSSSITPIGSGWHRFALQATSDGTTSITAQIALYNAAFSYTGDGVSGAVVYGLRLQRGTHSRAEDDYLVQTTSAAVYGARITYDPVTLECLGYLNEPQRTNLLLYNSDWTNAAWTAGGGASKVGQTVTFGANYTDYIFQNVACTVGQTYTHSVWLQAPVGLAFEVSITEVGGAFPSTATPVVGTGAPQLVSVTRTITSETTMSARLVATGVAVTVTLLSPGHQLELGATATSTIPTTGASATRAADDGQVTGGTFSGVWNAASGAIAVRGIVPTVSAASTLFQCDDGTANNRISLQVNASGKAIFEVVTGGATQCSIDAGSVTANTAFTLACRYGSNDFAASLNGASEVTDTSGTVPTVDRARLGASSAATSQATIDYARLYRVAPPLAALSA